MEYNGAHQVYNADGRPITVGKDKTPIVSTDKTIAGLGTYTVEHGTLLDRMAYTDKFSAMFDEAKKPDAEKESVISGAEEYAKRMSEAMYATYEGNTKRDKSNARIAAMTEVHMAQPHSAYFLPKRMQETMAGYSMKINRPTVKGEDVTYTRLDAPIPGSRKNMITNSSDPRMTYMGESSDQYKIRMAALDEELKAQAEAAKVAAETPQVSVNDVIANMQSEVTIDEVPKASPEMANAGRQGTTRKTVDTGIEADDRTAETEVPTM
jgi:hypothetical protein